MSKQGSIPSTDGAPTLPAAAPVFGESPAPAKRPMTGRHPARADAVTTEDANLKAASAPVSKVC
jgi:hypothetical protein